MANLFGVVDISKRHGPLAADDPHRLSYSLRRPARVAALAFDRHRLARPLVAGSCAREGADRKRFGPMGRGVHWFAVDY